jgi:hypothetical protein
MVVNSYRVLFLAMVLVGSAPVIGSCKTRHFQSASIENSNDPDLWVGSASILARILGERGSGKFFFRKTC